MLFDAHGDDLENGEEDRRRHHGRWKLQQGGNIGSYLSRGDHPVKRIVPRAASDGLESHEEHHSTEMGRQSAVQYNLCHSEQRRLAKSKSQGCQSGI
jgi:hypothetical protein